ncbi:uncharacterized protein EDB91DRAFT_1238875 [Suillus paluster]|uniref:uncharacterized protein n=1 Tax=Suillus paluster TaxID=48578 RepID=UPI001B8854E5|nr:uncharacterized protein EDB91DRAFT_1238875 [Suillus paluster]KAG1731841.1 hypothetical protein EDB91DRAFT_1238875 [Suillus paluster]
MVMPGPDEPSLEEMNYLLEPFVESMLRLEKGVEFTVHGHDDPEVSHSHLYCNISDLPSSRKVTGLQGHSSKFFMCPTCKTPSFSLAHPSCFDPSNFKDRDDWRYIKYSFRLRNADSATVDAIHENRGVHWSALNYLLGWMPARSSVVEFMHAVFLGLVKHLNRIILIKSGLLNGTRLVKPMDRLEAFFSGLVRPVEANRLPPSLSTGKGSPKVDQWRNQIAVLFVALYDAWAHLLACNTHPSDAETNRVNSAKMDCNLRQHYAVILEFSAAVCILSSQSISPDNVCRGRAALSHATQSWARMGCHLTPYFHFVNHFEQQMYEFGPCYATWAFAFERHNGKLAKINHNQHKGGELKATLMRQWWSITFNYELVRCLTLFSSLLD